MTGIDTSALEARSGRCAIVGRPNVGKSTLLNALLKQKLAIATPRPGTTRSCVLGVYASEDPPTQIAFVDTPGLAKPKSALSHVLIDQAGLGLTDADVVLFMTEALSNRDAMEVNPRDLQALAIVRESRAKSILLINKIDRVKDRTRLLPQIEAYSAAHEFDATLPISATKKINLDQLIAEIRQRLPKGKLYDDEFLTDRPERFFVAELIREAAIRNTREEVPYGVACTIDEYDEKGKVVRILATVIVEKKNHKGIVIGHKGSMLKKIGTEARLEIEKLIERRVYLELWVKVVEGWTNNAAKARHYVTQTES